MDNVTFMKEIESIDWLSQAKNIDSILNADLNLQWLPTSRDQEDPYPFVVADEYKSEAKDFALKSYRLALKSLRASIESKKHLLVFGPHDFTEAFKSAALYCVVRASKEQVSGEREKWTEIFEHFKNGKWPCGLNENGELVIL